MKSKIVINQTTNGSPHAKIFSIAILLLMIACGLLVLTKAIQGIGEARESGSWPKVAGKIVHSGMDVDAEERDVGRRSSSDSKFYSANIEYEFEINGVTHRGSRIAAVQDMNADKEHVQKVLNKYPLDRAVTVSYKPDDPSVCVLEPGSWGGVGVLLGLAAVFTLVPLVVLIVVWRISSNKTPSQSAVITVSQSHSDKVKVWVSIVLLVFIGIGCIPLTWAIQSIREADASKSWPTVPGTITKSSVGVTTTETRNRNNYRRTSHSYAAEIEYEFKVEGETYRGSRIAVVSAQFGDEAFAQATCDKYPLNKAVTVSYKPGDPSECVLEPGRWGGIGLQLAFAGTFIFLPLLFLKVFWLPKANVDQYGQSKEQRERFGLLFSERILEWEPGNLVHTHHDRAGFLKVLVGAVVGGLALGLVISLIPAVGLLAFKENLPRIITQHGVWFVVYFFAATSFVSVIGIAIWGVFDGRVRDSRIDWTRGTFRSQIGWSVHECPLEEISGLTLRLPSPKRNPNGANASLEQSKSLTAQVFVNVSDRKFVLLKIEFPRSARSSIRERLAPAAKELAQGLNVPLHEDISPP